MFFYLKDFGPDKLLPYLIRFSRDNPAKKMFLFVNTQQISVVALDGLFRDLFDSASFRSRILLVIHEYD